MLSSIAARAHARPFRIVERMVLQLSRSPFLEPGAADVRELPWQTRRMKAAIARGFAFALPSLILLILLRFDWPEAMTTAIVAAALLTCCVTDFLAYRVPNAVTLPALAVAVVAAALAGTAALGGALLGAGLCGGGLLAIAIATRGGLGGGDVKLAAMIGAALGLPGALFALAGGIVAGSLVVIALHVARVLRRGDVFPYAPFLSLAALGVLLA